MNYVYIYFLCHIILHSRTSEKWNFFGTKTKILHSLNEKNKKPMWTNINNSSGITFFVRNGICFFVCSLKQRNIYLNSYITEQ